MTTSVVWLRRDLRLHDNVALYEACVHSERVLLAFVLNPDLLRGGSVGAPLVTGFFDALGALRERLRSLGSDLALLEGDFARQLTALVRGIGATAVFYNEDYEPAAIRRDASVTAALQAAGIAVRASLDHVYFGAGDVVQNSGAPYKVFTPYRKRWLDQRRLMRRLPVPSGSAVLNKLATRELLGETLAVPDPMAYGHSSSANFPRVGEDAARALLDAFLAPGGAVECYAERRNVPSVEGTSHLSPQLRAGTIGIRECVEQAFARAEASSPVVRANVEAWIGELVWRDFYQMILRHFPHVATGAFLEAGNRVRWRDAPEDLAAWREGRTGYPIVDAAMRQLNRSGWMHNRLRMIVASFLAKDLLIDWRRGERYFEQRLADADLAQNNGGWQWAASTGTDGAPYLRIFNPVRQGATFDPAGEFVRRFVPELRDVPHAYVHEPWAMPPLVQAEARCEIGRDYPQPIVDHADARARAIAAFATAFRT